MVVTDDPTAVGEFSEMRDALSTDSELYLNPAAHCLQTVYSVRVLLD